MGLFDKKSKLNINQKINYRKLLQNKIVDNSVMCGRLGLMSVTDPKNTRYKRFVGKNLFDLSNKTLYHRHFKYKCLNARKYFNLSTEGDVISFLNTSKLKTYNLNYTYYFLGKIKVEMEIEKTSSEIIIINWTKFEKALQGDYFHKSNRRSLHLSSSITTLGELFRTFMSGMMNIMDSYNMDKNSYKKK